MVTSAQIPGAVLCHAYNDRRTIGLIDFALFMVVAAQIIPLNRPTGPFTTATFTISEGDMGKALLQVQKKSLH